MRICKIYDGDYPWDIRVDKIMSSLTEQGHEVHLICRNLAKRPAYEYVDKVHFHRLPCFKGDGMSYALSFPAFFNPLWLKTIFRVVKEHSIDVILVRDLPLTLSGVIIGRMVGVPVVFDMAEDYPAMVRDIWQYEGFKISNIVVRNPFILNLVETLSIRLADTILVVTQESKSRLTTQYQLLESKIHIVSNTPSLSAMGPARKIGRLPKSNSVIKLIYVGGLQAGRNLEIALRGMALSVDKLNCSLTIVGRGMAEPDLKKLADGLGIRERVFFKGWVDHHSIGTLLAETDIGIIPHPATEHTNTTVPNKLFDYMAYGKTVLASDTKPVQRIIESERCGLTYRYDSPEDFAEKLLQLRDSTIRTEMGDNGRKAVEKSYNWETDSMNFLKALEKYHQMATIEGKPQ